MSNEKIENMLNQVKEYTGLDYDSYVFYNPLLLKMREEYNMYSQLVGQEKESKLISSANDYIKNTDRFFGVSMVVTFLEESKRLSNSKMEDINKGVKKLFSENLSKLADTMEETRLNRCFGGKAQQVM